MTTSRMSTLINVGVLRGGPTSEYDISLRSGQHILNLLNSEPLNSTYKGIDILIDKDNVWHIHGRPETPESALRKVDVIFNATKGNFEKGEPLQRILETFSMPFVGTKTFGSALSKNKKLAKDQFKKQGIKTPYYKELSLPLDSDVNPVALDLFRSFPMPVIVKPIGQGSSLGVSFASNFDELIEALKHARGFSQEILVEEYLTGKEIISGFIDDFRGQDLYHLFPVEVKPHLETLGVKTDISGSFENSGSIEKNSGELNKFAESIEPIKLSDEQADMKTLETSVEDLSPEEQVIAQKLKNIKKPRHSIFSWIAKHAGLYDHTAPANITADEKKIIQDAMQKIRETLGLRHFATADFIVHPKRGVYLLEINTDPSMHEYSPIYKALDAGGIKHHEFLDHVLRLALEGKK
jgi:D-alanine-D-alanine ligase-like ATP-grasp enzyme